MELRAVQTLLPAIGPFLGSFFFVADRISRVCLHDYSDDVPRVTIINTNENKTNQNPNQPPKKGMTMLKPQTATSPACMCAYTKSTVIEFTLGHVADKWCEIETGVASILTLQNPGTSRWLVCSGTDGSGRLISPKTGLVLSTVFPPPPVVREGRALALAASRGAFVLYALINPMELWVYTVRTMPANRLQVWKGSQVTALLTSAMIQGRRKVDSEAGITSIACARHSGEGWPALPEPDKRKGANQSSRVAAENTSDSNHDAHDGDVAGDVDGGDRADAADAGQAGGAAVILAAASRGAEPGAEREDALSATKEVQLELTPEEEAEAAAAAEAAAELAKEICLIGTSDGRVLVINATSGELRAFFKASSNAITDVRVDPFSPEILVTASPLLEVNSGLHVVLWNLASFEPIKAFDTGAGTCCWSLSVHAGKALLATGHQDGSVRVALGDVSVTHAPTQGRTAGEEVNIDDGFTGTEACGDVVGNRNAALPPLSLLSTSLSLLSASPEDDCNADADVAVDADADADGVRGGGKGGGGGALGSNRNKNNTTIMSVLPAVNIWRRIAHRPTEGELAAEAATGLPGGNVAHAWHAEGKVLSVCADARVGRVLSSGQDGLLKVWDTQGLLKINIGLAEAVPNEHHDTSGLTHVSCASFLNRHGDVVVAFHGNLYRIDRSHIVKEDVDDGRMSPTSVGARALAKAKAEEELLGIYVDDGSSNDDGSDDPDEDPHAFLEDRNVRFEVIDTNGAYVDPKPTEDIDAYLSPFMDMLAAAGLDAGFSGPVMSAWLDGGDELVEEDSAANDDGKPRIDAAEFLHDAASIADTDVYHSDVDLDDFDGFDHPREDLQDCEDYGDNAAAAAAAAELTVTEQQPLDAGIEWLEPDLCFPPASPGPTPPRSPVMAKIRRRREDKIEKALAKLNEMKEQAEAEEKMRIETAATLKKEAAERKAIQDADDAKHAAAADLAATRENEEAADKKRKYLKRQQETTERNALLATQKAATDAEDAAAQAVRERAAVERAQKKRATPINKPKKAGPSRREQKAAAAEKEAAASPQRPPTGRPQAAASTPGSASRLDDSDSDAEGGPQFLTRKPPRSTAKLTPHNMQLPGVSKFKKRQPQEADPDSEPEPAAMLTTAPGPAAEDADGTSSLPPADDFPDTNNPETKKKKRKSKLGSLQLEMKPTREQLDGEAAEAAAAQAAIAAAVEQEGAEARLVAEIATAAAAERAASKGRRRPASASASYAGTNTPPCGTLYVQKEMPTRTVRTIKFATRGIPGQQPRPAPKAFHAPNGYPFENEEWRDGAYDHYERQKLQRESRSASARERRDTTRTDDLKRWGGRAPATAQLNITNTVDTVKVKMKKKKKKEKDASFKQRRSRPKSASSASSSAALLTSTSSRLLLSSRPKSPSVHSFDGYKATQKMTASMFQHRRSSASVPGTAAPVTLGTTDSPPRRSRTNDAADDALRRSLGLGKHDDLLDALLAANSSPSTSSPSRFRSSYSYSSNSHGALNASLAGPFSAGPRMPAPA